MLCALGALWDIKTALTTIKKTSVSSLAHLHDRRDRGELARGWEFAGTPFTWRRWRQRHRHRHHREDGYSDSDGRGVPDSRSSPSSFSTVYETRKARRSSHPYSKTTGRRAREIKMAESLVRTPTGTGVIHHAATVAFPEISLMGRSTRHLIGCSWFWI